MSGVKKRPVLVILSVVLLVFITLGFLAFWQIQAMISPIDTLASQDAKEIEIPYNSSTRQIASILEEENIITNEFLFRLYIRYFVDDYNFQAGHYQLTPGMSFDEIIEALQQGVVLKEGIRFTIPEGYTIEQIATRLSQRDIFDREEFLETAAEFNDTEKFPFLEAIPDKTKYRLEGYLFPDTYEISDEATASELISIMLDGSAKVLEGDFQDKLDEKGLSLHEALTLASIVEREARVDKERPLIAAVFHNRLDNEAMQLLQSCATVQYALGEVKPVLTYDDLEVDSPYNTYLNPGLPPGPIGSPGFRSIEATLYPAEVDYLYFVFKEDGTGTHYFSETLQEHNAYKRKVQSERE